MKPLGAVILTLVPTALVCAQDAAVTWYGSNFRGVLSMAGREQKSALVYCWNASNPDCQKLWQETLSALEERERFANFVCFSANTANEEGKSVAAGFHVETLPTVVVVAADGRPEDAIVGYVPQFEFDARIDRVSSGDGTVSELRRLTTLRPKDLALRFAFGAKLADVGDTSTADVVFASIREADPKARTLGGARLALRDAKRSIIEHAADPQQPKTYALSSMRALLAGSERPEVLFEGWDWMARIASERGDGKEAQAAVMKAAPHLPEDRVTDWPGAVSRMFWAIRADLGEEGKTFVSELVEKHYGPTYAARSADDAPEVPAGDRARQVQELTSLARGWFLGGRKDDAVAAMKLAVKLAPLDFALHDLLGAMEEGS